MKYIDADRLVSILKAQIDEREKWLNDSERSDRQDQLWSDLNNEDRIIISLVNGMKQEVIIPDNEILRHAERDLFGSHESAASQEAQRRYTSPCAPECCLLINTHDIISRIQTAFVEGVIWKENEELKEKKYGETD